MAVHGRTHLAIIDGMGIDGELCRNRSKSNLSVEKSIKVVRKWPNFGLWFFDTKYEFGLRWAVGFGFARQSLFPDIITSREITMQFRNPCLLTRFQNPKLRIFLLS